MALECSCMDVPAMPGEQAILLCSASAVTFRRYALACSTARSFPCSISSTASEGAIQFFAFTLYTDACTPIALSSENSRRCSPPILTSAQKPCSNIEEPLKALRRPASQPPVQMVLILSYGSGLSFYNASVERH